MNFINIPTYFTLLRVFMVPCFAVVSYLPVYWAPMVCACMFFITAITDWFDGFLARRWEQTTKFGKFLDPVADKIMLITAFILISEHFHVWWVTLPISSMIIREIIVSALRQWIAIIGKYDKISVSWIGKTKTCAQMLSVFALLWRHDEWIIITGIIALYISVLLTFWSMYCYVYAARFDLFYS